MAIRRDWFEEAIRLVVEATGDEELQPLLDSLREVGDTADKGSAEARAAMERLADTLDRIGQVEAFTKLKRDLGDTEQELEQAQAAAQKLFRELSEGGDGSGKLTRAQQAAARTVNDLSDAAQRQRLQLQNMRRELSAVGIDTRELGTAQGRLRGQMAEARQALVGSVDALQRYRRESARTADQVQRDNREIAGSYDGIRGSLGRLRGLAAGALAFLGIHEAVQGARNLAEVSAQAEDARRALQNLYGSREAGNRAYAALEQLSKRNGIAFDVLVESAKKLMAFGLDPLNGSLQALIDQNAAVGGSQEDLQGKVLALGQAWAKQKLQGEEILQLVERGVPVWDLLQKVTGKSVTELQKLSEAGKLGRDTIAALYQELGRANAGAANKALTSTSGLLAQISQRWVDFKRAIVDAGLGDYFKRQMQELLQATGGMDGLAQRVSAGIVGTLEAIKSLGAKLAIIAKPIASLTLALARHAEAVVLLGKVYLGLKLAQWASGFASLARNTQAATAATSALTAAETARAGGLSRLGGVLSRIPRAVTVTFAVVGLEVLLHGIDTLNKGLEARAEAIAHGDRLQHASQQLQQEQLQLGRQLQALYKDSAATVIASGERVSRMTREQADGYLFALQNARKFFGGVIREARAAGDAQAEATATEKWKALGAAVDDVKDRIHDLDQAAATATGVRAFATNAVAEFDKLVSSAKSAREAVQGIFTGINFGDADGVAQALDIIEQVGARGTAAAEAIQAELRTALTQVAAADLPALKEAAADAFGSGSAAARAFAAEVDRVNLSRLGVDIDAIKTGFTDVGREAVDAFNGAIAEVDRLGLTVEQRSKAIAQAFDNAFKQASTKAELEALKKALQSALSAGDLGFQEFQQRITETDAKLAELGGAGKKVGEDIAEGASKAASSLDQVSTAAESAASQTADAGGAATAAAAEMDAASQSTQQFALSLFEISEKAALAYDGTNKLAGSPLWNDAVNRVTHMIDDQGAALQREVAALREANAQFDELAGRRAALAQKYDLLGTNEIEKLVQAQAELERNRERAESEQARKREAEQRAAAARQEQQQEDAREAAKEVAQTTAPTVPPPRPPSTSKPLEVRLVVDATGAAAQSALQLTPAHVQQLVRALTPAIIAELERRRMASR